MLSKHQNIALLLIIQVMGKGQQWGKVKRKVEQQVPSDKQPSPDEFHTLVTLNAELQRLNQQLQRDALVRENAQLMARVQQLEIDYAAKADLVESLLRERLSERAALQQKTLENTQLRLLVENLETVKEGLLIERAALQQRNLELERRRAVERSPPLAGRHLSGRQTPVAAVLRRASFRSQFSEQTEAALEDTGAPAPRQPGFSLPLNLHQREGADTPSRVARRGECGSSVASSSQPTSNGQRVLRHLPRDERPFHQLGRLLVGDFQSDLDADDEDVMHPHLLN
jgi:hypothetical protein